jgi:hypothetical protein
MLELYATGMALLNGAAGFPNWKVTIWFGMTTGFLIGASIAEVISFFKHDAAKRLLAFPIGGVIGVIFTIILFII